MATKAPPHLGCHTGPFHWDELHRNFNSNDLLGVNYFVFGSVWLPCQISSHEMLNYKLASIQRHVVSIKMEENLLRWARAPPGHDLEDSGCWILSESAGAIRLHRMHGRSATNFTNAQVRSAKIRLSHQLQVRLSCEVAVANWCPEEICKENLPPGPAMDNIIHIISE